MYRIYYFLTGLISKRCEQYTIWSQPNLLFYWKNSWNMLTHCGICNAQWFPIIYWSLFFFSILGLLRSLAEFVRVFCYCDKPISMFLEHHYFVVTISLLMQARVIGSILMIAVWSQFFYGLTTVSPKLMMPWLWINTIVLASEVVIYTIDSVNGYMKFTIGGLLKFVIPIGGLYCAHCVRDVFECGVAANSTDKLVLWP